jgi:hypothetical protein
MSDFLTQLTSSEGKPAAKRFRLVDGILQKQDMQMSMFFDTDTVPVSSLHELAAALSELQQDTASMVIRGALIEGRETQSIRRTGKASLWNDPGSNFNAMPRQWCMIDIDDLPLPPEFADISVHQKDILAYTVARLPEAFRGVDCYFQFSASMGIKTDMVRVHLWYWLDRPANDREMTAWLSQSEVPVDLSLFRPVQPHFTAHPVFVEGAVDPLPARSGIYQAGSGQLTVNVPDNLHVLEVSRRAATRQRHIRANGFIEAQEIVRDPDTGLAVDGREKLLYQLSLDAMTVWVRLTKGKQHPPVDNLTDRIWEAFEAEADLSDGKWSISDARSKAGARVADYQSGRFDFTSRSDSTTLYPVDQPYFLIATVDKEAGAKQLDDALRGFFEAIERDRRPRLALRVTMGAGKTRQTIEHLKSYLNRTYSTDVEIYVPRHDIADEYEQRLRRGEQPGSTVTHIYGRRGLEKQVPALCSRYEYVEQLEMAGVSVYRNACFRSGTEICDSYNSCAYITQFRDDGGYSPLQNNVRIYQHVSLALPRNRLESEPNIVIVDEAFLTNCLRRESLSAEQVRNHLHHPDFPNLGAILVDALKVGGEAISRLREQGVSNRILAELDFDALQPDVPFDPNANTAPRIQSASLYRFLNRLRSILIEEFALDDREQLTRVLYDLRNGEIVLTYLENIRIPETAALLILDATCDETILRQAVGDIELSRIDIEQKATVSQVYDRTGSNRWWNDADKEVAKLVSVMNEWASFGEKVLCISHKMLADRLRGAETLHDAVMINHFGNIRGSNEAEDCTVIFITGRNQPSPPDIDIAARALFWNDGEQLQHNEGSRIDIDRNQTVNLPLELRGYTMKDPSSGLGVNSRSFTDPRIEKWHQQLREAETVQAIARLRLVHSPIKKRVFLLGNLPIEMPIDEVLPYNDLMPERMEAELFRAGNLPLSQLGLQIMRPDLVQSEKAAENMLNRSKFKRPATLTLDRFGRTFPDLRRATMCIVTFAATRNGRTREHAHLFLLPGQQSMMNTQATVASLPVDQWRAFLEQGDPQIAGSGWGTIEIRDVGFVPATH